MPQPAKGKKKKEKLRQTKLLSFLKNEVGSPLPLSPLFSPVDDSLWRSPPSKTVKVSSPEFIKPSFRDKTVYSVSKVEDQSNEDKIIEFYNRGQPNVLFTCTLEGFWSYTNIKHGDSVLFIDCEDSLRVTDDSGMVVVNPQRLIPVTTLANSNFCLRKSILSQRFLPSSSTVNKQTITGIVVHRLIEKFCLELHFDFEDSMNTLLTENLDILTGLMLNRIDALEIIEEVKKYKSGIFSFLSKLHSNQMTVESVEEPIKSKILGISGKIDVLTKMTDNKFVPIEVKSGRNTNANYLSHSAQIQLYSLLLSHSDVKRTKNGGYLYYPIEGGVITHVPHSAAQQNSLLQSRNVFCHYMTSPLKDLPDMICNANICCKCELSVVCLVYQNGHSVSPKLKHVLSHLTQADLDYFMHWQMLLDLERSENSHVSDKSKCFLTGKRIRSERTSNYVMLELDDGEVVSGSVVYLMAGGREHTLIVEEASGNLLTTTCRCDPENIEFNVTYELQMGAFEQSYHVALSYLGSLMQNTHKMADLRSMVVLGVESVRLEIGWEGTTDELNEQQSGVVRKALCGNDQAILVAGYPGCGKTTMVSHLIRILVEKGQNVLVVSHTNTAVDGLANKLVMMGVLLWRFGNKTKMADVVKEHSFEDVIEKRLKLGGMDWKEMEEQFYSRRVVVSTCHGCVNPILSSREYDWCIVEESCQTMQSLVLGPLALARRVLLIGDPLQLMPIARSKLAKSRGICQSLFTRLEPSIPPIALSEQYRMNEKIAQLANSLMYKNQLKCGTPDVASATISYEPNEEIDCERWMERVLSRRLDDSVLFLNYCSKESNSRVCNRTEADIVLKIVTVLRKLNVCDERMGVITPYNAQSCMINNLIKPVECSTIDKFQGREKDIIIISFVKCEIVVPCSNEARKSRGHINEGILSDIRRLSVAITRAKHKLIMVGHEPTLQSHYHTMCRLFESLDNQIVDIV